ncbi:MAG: hypothetical protein RR497_06595 [Oscillospiraceae bacterium]
MKKKSKTILIAITGITALVGFSVAIATYLRKKAEVIKEELDFDPNIYLEDEDLYDSPEFHEYELDEKDSPVSEQSSDNAESDDKEDTK